jgi:hypothetical protein
MKATASLAVLAMAAEAFVHPFPADAPKNISPIEQCEVCRAIMEVVPNKLGKKAWSNVNVVTAMEGICNGEVSAFAGRALRAASDAAAPAQIACEIVAPCLCGWTLPTTYPSPTTTPSLLLLRAIPPAPRIGITLSHISRLVAFLPSPLSLFPLPAPRTTAATRSRPLQWSRLAGS